MLTDLRYAVRSLLKTPGFTLVAVLTIAVGIGANAALLSIFNQLILKPVTLPSPSSLVAIWSVNQNLNFNAPAVSWPRYEFIRTHAKSFSSIADSTFDNFTLTGNGEPEQLNGLRITASFFPTLGINLFKGRNFTTEEDLPNGAAVCLLSYELWQTRFGARESVIGETIQLNGRSWEVIGITSPKLSNPFTASQIFAPRPFEVAGLTAEQIERGASYSQPIARLKPGVMIDQAKSELLALSATYTEQFSTKLDAQNISEPRLYVDTLVANLRPTFYTLLGAVAFVLLIACANVANLFLSRLSARHKEIAVRQSLNRRRWTRTASRRVVPFFSSVVVGVPAPAQHDSRTGPRRGRDSDRSDDPQQRPRRTHSGSSSVVANLGRYAEGHGAWRSRRNARRKVSRDAHRGRGGALGCAPRRSEPATTQLHPVATHAGGI
jgi:predicted permease